MIIQTAAIAGFPPAMNAMSTLKTVPGRDAPPARLTDVRSELSASVRVLVVRSALDPHPSCAPIGRRDGSTVIVSSGVAVPKILRASRTERLGRKRCPPMALGGRADDRVAGRLEAKHGVTEPH